MLEFQMTAAGSTLSAVRWKTQYVDMEPPSHVMLRTVWNHTLEWDLGFALTGLFVVGALTVGWIAVVTCQRHRGGEAVSKLFDDDEDTRDPHVYHMHRRYYGHASAPEREHVQRSASMHGSKAD